MHTDPSEPVPLPLVATVVAGPAAGVAAVLRPGRQLIGRGPMCDVAIRDRSVEVHHIAVDLDPDGGARLTQLAGRRPVVVEGRPIDGVTALDPPALVALGGSLVRVDVAAPPRAAMAIGEVAGDAARRLVLRPPRPPRIAPDSIIPLPTLPPGPPSPPGTASIVGGLVGGVAALTLASIVGQPMFAVFGMLGAVVSIATWGVQRAGWARAARRARAESAAVDAEVGAAIDAASDRVRAHHLESVSTAAGTSTLVGTDAQWARRAAHGDAFEVSIGIGDVERPITLHAASGAPVPPGLSEHARRRSRLASVPFDVRLDAHDPEVIAITGPDREALAAAIVAQLAVQTGPADWSLVAALERPDEHAWAHRLPHSGIGGLPGLVAAADAGALAELLGQLRASDRRPVVLTDRPSLLTDRSTPIRQFLDGGRPATVVVVVGEGDAVPAVATAVVEIGSTGIGRWAPRPPAGSDESPWPSAPIHIAGIDLARLDALARAMSVDVDPEQHGESSHALPTDVALGELPGVPGDVDAVLAGWERHRRDRRAAAPIGVAADGPVVVDLAGDGPHALVAGTTGAGKSELLRTLVVSLAAQCPPEHLQFVLIDYKGGAAFDACTDLPHVAGVVTDLDAGLAERAITGLRAELRRRERVLRDHGVTDLDAHNGRSGSDPLARLVVVVDEFAVLAADHPRFMSSLVDVARRGRSLGVHLVLATQRPAGVVDDAIRANTDLRIALRLRDAADAIDVVDDAAPTRIARRHRGRAVLRSGGGSLVEVQIAHSGADLREVIEVISAAHARFGGAAVTAPWQPPLPALLDRTEARAVGLVDDPATQSQGPLHWSPADGNLALTGARRTGTTSALLALAASVAESGSCQLYVLDARGDDRLAALEGDPACAGVVRGSDRERLDRALRRLGDELGRRLAGCRAERGPNVVVLVDGLVALRAALADRTGEPLLAVLDRLLVDGPGVGIVVAAVVEPHGAAAVAGRFAVRWLFHVDDPAHAVAVGVAPSDVPPPVPGRIVDVATGRAAQLVMPGPRAAARTPGADDPAPIGRLPALIDASTLPAGVSGAAGVRLPIGYGHLGLGVFDLELLPGEHLLVVGAARSGRTRVLDRVRTAWREANPDGTLWLPDDAGRLLAGLLDGTTSGAHLVAVDDADHVPDDGGELGRLLSLGRPDVTVVATIRADLARGRFGHWSAALARQRTAVVLAAASDHADLAGVVEPLRSPIDARPGLAWVVQGGRCSLVQIATRIG